jgi:hypothetical protein
MGVFSFSHFFRWGMPEVGGPRCQDIREAFCATDVSHLRQKGFRGAIAISLCASGEQRQSIRHVPTQIPRAIASGIKLYSPTGTLSGSGTTGFL